MAHSASIQAGAEYCYSANSHLRPAQTSIVVQERNHSAVARGLDPRSLHGPARTYPVTAGPRAGVLSRDHQTISGQSTRTLTETIIHAFVLDRQSCGRSPETIKAYLSAARDWLSLSTHEATPFDFGQSTFYSSICGRNAALFSGKSYSVAELIRSPAEERSFGGFHLRMLVFMRRANAA